jgi:hypothetical protein
MKLRVFTPTYESEDHNLQMTPEMVAAIFARYSRQGEGLDAILEQLENTPNEKFEETVWKFLDFGHASIGGLTGTIPVAMDRVSMLSPYLSFFLQPKQDGQETSTRYVEFKPEGLAAPESFGIPERFHSRWYDVMMEGFRINKQLVGVLDDLASKHPELTKIDPNLPKKTQERMLKNFGLDRARYTIPMAGLTNFGLVMTSREWAETIKYMGSFDFPESKKLGAGLREQISRVTPRLMNHSMPTDRTLSFANDFLDRGVEYILKNGIYTGSVEDEVFVETNIPTRPPYIHPGLSLPRELAVNFEGKKTRYDFAKGLAEKIRILVAWNNMSIAEARDINRQRPCTKDTLLAPIGSYMPEISIDLMREGKGELFGNYSQFLENRAELMTEIVNSEAPRSYVGCLLLGDQTPFELHTNASHFAYVAELRTSMGVHFRYDQHMRDAHKEVVEQIPGLEPYIELGTGEPE